MTPNAFLSEVLPLLIVEKKKKEEVLMMKKQSMKTPQRRKNLEGRASTPSAKIENLRDKFKKFESMNVGGERVLENESLRLSGKTWQNAIPAQNKVEQIENVGDNSKVVECLTSLRTFGRGNYDSGIKTACPRGSTTLLGIASGVERAGGTGLPIGGRQQEPATSGKTSQSHVAVQRVHHPRRGGGWGVGDRPSSMEINLDKNSK